MMLNYSTFKDEDIFVLTDFKCDPAQDLFEKKGLFKVLWSKEEEVDLKVDGYQLKLKKNQIIFCTPLNIMEVPMENKGLISFVFNKQFFCIQTHDDQVSCHGFLFFGSAQPQVIDLTPSEEQHFEMMHQMFIKDLSIKDQLQGEMLRSLLKRLLISSTRMLKEAKFEAPIENGKMNIIRKYYILVEQHFKEFHQVKDYANLLFKSPKTLSNIFSNHEEKSPLMVINERILLEAKRLLLYSNQSNDEIAEELGYKDAGHFSKFFKKHTKLNPSSYKKAKLATS